MNRKGVEQIITHGTMRAHGKARNADDDYSLQASVVALAAQYYHNYLNQLFETNTFVTILAQERHIERKSCKVLSK